MEIRYLGGLEIDCEVMFKIRDKIVIEGWRGVLV